MRAAVRASQPQRALAHYRLMISRGVRADAVTLLSVIEANLAEGRPLAAVADAPIEPIGPGCSTICAAMCHPGRALCHPDPGAHIPLRAIVRVRVPVVLHAASSS